MTLAWLHRQNLHVQHTQQGRLGRFNLKGGQKLPGFLSTAYLEIILPPPVFSPTVFFPDLELRV